MRIEVDGRARAVAVRRAERGFLVTVDGRALHADLVRIGSRWSLLVGTPEAASAGGPVRSYEIATELEPGGVATITVNGRAVRTLAGDPGRWRPGRPSASAFQPVSGAQPVVAPMAGRVVKVLVKAGDPVALRQGLVVVEAMKMENELRAAAAGVVTEVRVVEGAPVDAGAVLLIVDSMRNDR